MNLKEVKKHSKEHNRKISESNKGRKYSNLIIEKYKLSAKLRGVSDITRKKCIEARSLSIIQYSLNGDFIKEWFSISLAAKELNISRTAINGCCSNNGVNKTAGGYKWKYKI